jgi:ABC-2 type transport system permease protein
VSAITPQPRRVGGPSALGGSLHSFTELTLSMAQTEFKLRYFGSVLGYFWSLIRPLLFFGVLYVFFTQIVKIGKGIPHYGVYLLTGIVLWNYFLEATGNSVQSMVAREALLRKIRFPRMVVPLATSLTAVFNLGMNMIAVVLFAVLNGIAPTLSWFWMLPIIGGFIVLATGAGLFLSSLYVRFRDLQPIWDVTAQILFYASPIMYTVVAYNQFQKWAMLNPVAVLLTQMGHSFIHPEPVPRLSGGHVSLVQYMPSALQACGSPLRLAMSLSILAGAFGIGWLVFVREAPQISENL